MRVALAFSTLALVLVACGGNDGVASNAGAGGSGSNAGTGGAAGLGGSGGASGGAGGSAGVGGSAGAGGSAGTGGANSDLCTTPAGNLFAHGDFEEGMNGVVPAFWELRDPAAPVNCAGSGTPAEHVFLTAAPPGCGGNALAVDARGQWDCFAIQRVSDYNSIEGGATYRISAAVRSTGNSVNPAAWFLIGAQWLDANDAFFGDVKNEKTATAADNDFDWKPLSFDVVAPANAKRILVWLSAHYPGRADFDSVSVTKL